MCRGSARRDRADGIVTSDPYLRRMITWTIVALVGTILFAVLVVEVTLRWFQPQ
jgi:hypothetical protein